LAFAAGQGRRHGRKRPASRRERTIRFGDLAVDARGYGVVVTQFFLTKLRTLPARIAFCSVLRFN
jgi:hypothetical protein